MHIFKVVAFAKRSFKKKKKLSNHTASSEETNWNAKHLHTSDEENS